MAFQFADTTTPTTIEKIKACLQDPGMCGRGKRNRLAAIADESGVEARNRPWVGHVLALSCESLEKCAINDIMTNGHGIYKRQWDKWKLGEEPPPWQNRKGEDKIQDLVYDLLMKDLIKLYQSGLSVRRVKEKVKAEIGIVIIKETHLDARLKLAGVKRNLKGQVPKGKDAQSQGSPSTVGYPTPTSIPITHVSPRPKFTGRISPTTSNTPSIQPTSIYPTYSSNNVSRRSNTALVTHRSIQSPALQSANSHRRGRTNKSSDINSLQQEAPRNPKHTGHSPDILGGGLQSISLSGNEVSINMDNVSINMDDMSHNGPLIRRSSHSISSSSGSFEHIDFHDLAPVQSGSLPMMEVPYHAGKTRLGCNRFGPVEDGVSHADGSSNNYNTSCTSPLVLTAEVPSNNAFNQMCEQVKLLSKRLDDQQAARAAEANEIVTRFKKSYEGVYKNQELRIKDLEGICETLNEATVREQTKSEKLSDDIETLQQKHDGLDATVQRLKNSNGELRSQVLELQSENVSREEIINGLQSTLKSVKAENTELKTDLGLLHGNNNSLLKKNDSLIAENTKLQIAYNKLLGGYKELRNTLTQQKNNFHNETGKLQDENCQLQAQVDQLRDTDLEGKLKTERKVGTLQQETDTLQTENTELQVQISHLQEIMAKQEEKVALLEREHDSRQEESTAPDVNPNHQVLAHISHLTFDSAIGGSVRGSGASSRKRQSSITDEQDKKRHRSLQPLGEDNATFLPIMSTSGLPIRSGSEGPAHSADHYTEGNMF